MHAEERKELETNALRRWMLQTKDRLQGRTVYMIVGAIVLLIAALVIFFYWRASIRAANSARIMELVSADSDKKLDEIIASEKHKGKLTATWAKLQKARLVLYRDGMEKIGTPDPELRKAAFAKLEEGRKLYLEIVNDLKDNTSLQQEAWLACARAEEALLGAPQEEDPTKFRGSFEKAIEYYGKAAGINADSEVSKGYANLMNKKKGQQAEIEKFYQDLYRLGTTPKINLTP